MMVDNMKLLALLAALPLQNQTLWLVSSPDGHMRTSGRCLQAWRSTASPRAIFSCGHGVNVSASTRPRHEGRRRCSRALCAVAFSCSTTASCNGTRGAGFIRTCCAESASFREYHSSVSPHGGLWGYVSTSFRFRVHRWASTLLPSSAFTSGNRSSTSASGFDVLQHGTRYQCLFPPPSVGAQRRGHSECFATATSRTITANITWCLLSSPC